MTRRSHSCHWNQCYQHCSCAWWIYLKPNIPVSCSGTNRRLSFWRSSAVWRPWAASTWPSCSCRRPRRKVRLSHVSDVSHTYHLCFVFFNNTFYLVVLTDLFDFLQQAELEKSSVAALRKKYGMWALVWTTAANTPRWCGFNQNEQITVVSKGSVSMRTVFKTTSWFLTCFDHI